MTNIAAITTPEAFMEALRRHHRICSTMDSRPLPPDVEHRYVKQLHELDRAMDAAPFQFDERGNVVPIKGLGVVVPGEEG